MTDTPKKSKQRKPNVGSDPTVGSKVKWWQGGLYAVTIGTALILVGITLVRLVQGQFNPAAAVAAVLIGGFAWALLSASDKSVHEPGGLRVANSEPELTRFISSVADTVGAPDVDQIFLVVEPRLTVVEETRFFGLQHKRRMLILGLPFLHTMTTAEVAALTAHHLGLSLIHI